MEPVNTYEKIILIGTYNKTKNGINPEHVMYADDIHSYTKIIKSTKLPLEIVGRQGQMVKPYFDIDLKLPKNTIFDEMNRLVKWGDLIQKTFKLTNSKDIYILKCEPRPIDDNTIKYSYHILIDNIKISSSKIKQIIKDNMFPPEFDTSCYSVNQGVRPPFVDTKIKVDGKLPPFKPYSVFNGYIDDALDITKYCISYIKEDFKDYDAVLSPPKIIENPEKPLITDNEADDVDDDDDTNDIRSSEEYIKVIKKHVEHLSKQRASNYDTWLEVCMCIINIGEKYKWKDEVIFDLCDKFSKKNKVKYDYDANKKQFYKLMGDDTRVKKVCITRLLKCLKEDDPVYYKSNIFDSYNKVKELFEKQYCIINNPPCIYRVVDIPIEIRGDIELNEGDTDQLLKKEKAHFLNENLYYLCNEFNDKGKAVIGKKLFFNEWSKDPARLTYEGVKFAPSGLSPAVAKYYKNLFSGFKADKIYVENYDYKNIEPILNHLKLVYCDGNEEHYNYVLKWLAKIVQDPENRPQVGLVFYSRKHGTGRNTFTNFFMNQVIGTEYCVSCHDVSRVFGRFNKALAKCMFLCIEEASGEIKLFMENMKNLVTEPTILVERKNIDSGVVKNYVNAMLLTNNEDVLDIDDNDRRFAIFESSACMKNDETYFKNLYGCMDKTETAGIFIKYLREEVDASWTPMEFQKYRPITNAYRKQKALNAKNYMKFISNITDDDGVMINGVKNKWGKYKPVKVRVSYKALWGNYKVYCENFICKPYTYDKFINNITAPETGIIAGIDGHKKTPCLAFYKDDVLKWVEEYRNTDIENLPIIDSDDDGFVSDDE